jgi:hypothetical protein
MSARSIRTKVKDAIVGQLGIKGADAEIVLDTLFDSLFQHLKDNDAHEAHSTLTFKYNATKVQDGIVIMREPVRKKKGKA